MAISLSVSQFLYLNTIIKQCHEQKRYFCYITFALGSVYVYGTRESRSSCSITDTEGNIIQLKSILCICICTGCPRRNVPDSGKVFLMLKYDDTTQNTYVQSWTVAEIGPEKYENFTGVTHLLITKYILKLAGICGFCNVNNVRDIKVTHE
jgi:hypothetical protein